MIPLKTFPEWETIAEHQRNSLGYSEATILRTSYTYSVFVNGYCTFEGNDAAGILRNGIKKADKAYKNGAFQKISY